MNIEVLEKKESTVGWQFKVRLTKGADPVDFEVELDSNYYQKLTDSIITPEELVKRSFQFLLKNESINSILKNFNLRDIQIYFPGYEEQVLK